MDGDHNLSAIFVAIPPVQYELMIEVVGSGITDPPPGNYMYVNGTEVAVEAFPNASWLFDHWMLDGDDAGDANPIHVMMDSNHTLTAVFVEAPPPPQPMIESCDEDGNKKDFFELTDIVCVNGINFSPSTTYDFYIVEDVAWVDGMVIPSRVSGTATTILSDELGNIPVTAVWNEGLLFGKYDIIVDVNGNGIYDEGIDVLDDNDIEVTAGFVIPELTSLLSAALFLMATSLVAIAYRKKKPFLSK